MTMLGQTTYENGCKVLDRVIRLYQREYPMETVRFNTAWKRWIL